MTARFGGKTRISRCFASFGNGCDPTFVGSTAKKHGSHSDSDTLGSLGAPEAAPAEEGALISMSSRTWKMKNEYSAAFLVNFSSYDMLELKYRFVC